MKRAICLLVLLCAVTAVFAQKMDGRRVPPPIALNQIQPSEPRTPIRQADLPLTITQPGSYFVAENLTATSSPAITVAGDGVTIDFMGFSLSGNGGTGVTGEGATVHGGFVTGFDLGVAFTGSASVTDMRVTAKKLAIHVGPNSIVIHSSGRAHDGDEGTGIVAGDRSIVSESSGYGGGDLGEGIRVGDHCVVLNSAGDGDYRAGVGIETGSYSTVQSSAASGNIRANEFSSIVDSTSFSQAIIVYGRGGIIRDSAAMEIRVFGEKHRVTGTSSEYMFVQGEGNVLNGNVVGEGIEIAGPGNVVEGNTVGRESSAPYRLLVSGSRNILQDNILTGAQCGIQFTGPGNLYRRNTQIAMDQAVCGAGLDGGGNVQIP